MSRSIESRILNDAQITPETLRAMEPRIAASTDVILPGYPLDVVAYGCTSASMAIGEEKVFERIRSARPDARCTTPITGAFAAFRALKAKRIGVLTPYRADVNRIVADYIRARGFEVPVFGSFNEQDDGVVARITPASVKRGVDTILPMRRSMRCSCPARQCGWQRRRATSRRRRGFRSPPPTTPWPGTRCGSLVSMT